MLRNFMMIGGCARVRICMVGAGVWMRIYMCELADNDVKVLRAKQREQGTHRRQAFQNHSFS